MITAAILALCLNGSWEFRFERDQPLEACPSTGFAATDTVTVPSCYDVLPKWKGQRGTGLYRRSFKLETAMKDAVLVIDGMGLRGRFEIDGKDLGIHPYPYLRLELPVGSLTAGEHIITAALDNRFDFSTLKLARPYYDFYCHGGFYHGVKIVEKEPKVFVRTLDYAARKVEVDIEGAGKKVLTLPEAKLWSPEEPNLTTIEAAGREVRFGIRQIEVKDRKIYLNGRELFLKGFNRHEAHPEFGAATPEALMVADIQNLKAMSGNFIRGSHYPQCERFLDLCDELGVLVWEESLGWGNNPGRQGYPDEYKDAEFIRQQVFQTVEMTKASFNHPSVIITGYLNEFASNRPECKRLSDEICTAVRALDSGRLLAYAGKYMTTDISYSAVDIIAINLYPGWIRTNAGTSEQLVDRIHNDPEQGVDVCVRHLRGIHPSKPIIISEFGTTALPGFHDCAEEPVQGTEEFQAEYLKSGLDAIFANPEISGVTVWHLADALTYHRDGAPIRTKLGGQNFAGVYDCYRRPKAAVRIVRDAFNRK